MARREIDYNIFDVVNLEFGQWEKKADHFADGTILCRRKSDIEFFGLEFTVHQWSDTEEFYNMDLYDTPASKWGWSIREEREEFNRKVGEMISEEIIKLIEWETIECSK
jgi:hypothetical protein